MCVTEEAFDRFCELEYPAVYRGAYAFCGDHDVALEATQEAFSRAFARWRRLRREPWAAGWVMTTALNLCRRSFKQPRPGLPAQSVAPLVDLDLRVDMVDALRALPFRQRQAVLLYYLADLPVAAVADLMNASEGTVKAHLARARRGLRDWLVASESGAES